MNNFNEQIPLCYKDNESNELKSLLNDILEELKKGNIPNAKSADYLKTLFMHYLQWTETQKVSTTRERKNTYSIDFNDIIDSDNDKSERLATDFANKKIVELLHRLGLEKIVETGDVSEVDELLTSLLDDGLISIMRIGKNKFGDIEYYMLTTKGWHILLMDAVQRTIHSIDPSFLFPSAIVTNPMMISKETLWDFHQIKRFYSQQNISHYMVFSDKEFSQLICGCAISDQQTLEYCIASFGMEKLGTEITFRVHQLCKTDRINHLIIIVETKEDANRLKLQTGLDSKKVERLEYYCLEGASKND